MRSTSACTARYSRMRSFGFSRPKWSWSSTRSASTMSFFSSLYSFQGSARIQST